MNIKCPTCGKAGKPATKGSVLRDYKNVYNCTNPSCNTMVFNAKTSKVIMII